MFLLKANKSQLSTAAAELAVRLNVMFVDTRELSADVRFVPMAPSLRSFQSFVQTPFSVMFIQTVMILFFRFWAHQAGLENEV